MISEEAVSRQVESMGKKTTGRAQSQVYMGSLGKVADSYLPGVTPGLGKRAKNELSNRLAAGKLKKDLGEFKKGAFLSEANELYVAYQEAFARADFTTLRELVSPTMLTLTKARLAARSGKNSLRWKGIILSSSVLTIRFIPVDEMALNFGQIAVQYRTRQSVQMLGEKSGEKSGENEKVVLKSTAEKELTETWVLERVTNRPDERWRWCGSLPLPPGELSLVELQEQQTKRD